MAPPAFPLKGQAAVRPMGEPAQARQFGVLALPQPGKHLTDHTIHLIGGLTLGYARAAGNALRDFRFLHPISL
jgi:hypothetical protein